MASSAGRFCSMNSRSSYLLLAIAMRLSSVEEEGEEWVKGSVAAMLLRECNFWFFDKVCVSFYWFLASSGMFGFLVSGLRACS